MDKYEFDAYGIIKNLISLVVLVWCGLSGKYELGILFLLLYFRQRRFLG